MPHAAVLGCPIDHSLSPTLHNAGYAELGLEEWSYGRFQVEADQLQGFLAEAPRNYQGFSVTMPCKFAALEAATTSTQRARLVGSANTLVRTESGWHADNTDTDGVLGALGELLGDSPRLGTAVVVGAGGTARPALWALAQLGARRVVVVNRSDRSTDLAPLVQKLDLAVEYQRFDGDLRGLSHAADVIVSTVPSAGLDGHLGDLSHAPVLDVIYDPWPTPLVAHAAADGYPTLGGHVMLAQQAFCQFEQFTGHPAPKAAMRRALEQAIYTNE